VDSGPRSEEAIQQGPFRPRTMTVQDPQRFHRSNTASAVFHADPFLVASVLLVAGVVGSVLPAVPGGLLSTTGVGYYWWAGGDIAPLAFGLLVVLGLSTVAVDWLGGAVSARVGGAADAGRDGAAEPVHGDRGQPEHDEQAESERRDVAAGPPVVAHPGRREEPAGDRREDAPDDARHEQDGGDEERVGVEHGGGSVRAVKTLGVLNGHRSGSERALLDCLFGPRARVHCRAPHR